jgi:hypothetical protein
LDDLFKEGGGGLWIFYQFSDQNEMIANAKKKK